jgi:hypothetical protein
MAKKLKGETFMRINSRVSKEQHKFIKDLAEKLEVTEGEAHRIIIKYYMGHAK